MAAASARMPRPDAFSERKSSSMMTMGKRNFMGQHSWDKGLAGAPPARGGRRRERRALWDDFRAVATALQSPGAYAGCNASRSPSATDGRSKLQLRANVVSFGAGESTGFVDCRGCAGPVAETSAFVA